MALSPAEYRKPSNVRLGQKQPSSVQAVAHRAIVGVRPPLLDRKQRSTEKPAVPNKASIPDATITLEALRLIAQTHNSFMITSDLILALNLRFEPTGDDAEIVEGRGGTRFSQRVRDLVSHRTGGNGLETSGFVVYSAIRQGFTITPQGRQAAHEKQITTR